MAREKGDLIIGKMFKKYGHSIGSCGNFPYDLVVETIQEAKKEVFDDISKHRKLTGCILINPASFEMLKKEHLNTGSTELKNKEGI